MNEFHWNKIDFFLNFQSGWWCEQWTKKHFRKWFWFREKKKKITFFWNWFLVFTVFFTACNQTKTNKQTNKIDRLSKFWLINFTHPQQDNRQTNKQTKPNTIQFHNFTEIVCLFVVVQLKKLFWKMIIKRGKVKINQPKSNQINISDWKKSNNVVCLWMFFFIFIIFFFHWN